jgi:hypothetical protein
MCQYISAIWNPHNRDIQVADLESHRNTFVAHGLRECGPYQEMHYLPDGRIECRYVSMCCPSQEADAIERAMEAHVKSRWPTFQQFEAWAKHQLEQLSETVRARLPEPKPKPRPTRAGVYDRWIAGQADKQGNVHSDGDTLYSYGWYAIARIVDRECKIALMVKDRYSITTGKHIHRALCTLHTAGYTVFTVDNVTASDYVDNLAGFEADIDRAINRADHARGQKKSHMRYVNYCVQQMGDYIDTFDLG